MSTADAAEAVSAAEPQARIKRRKKPRQGQHPLIWLAVVAIIVFCLFPFYWLLNVSLKTGADLSSSSLIPPNPTLDNYSSIFKNNDFTSALKNSVIITSVTTILALIVGSFAAYALARLRFKGKFWILAGLQVIPDDIYEAAKVDGSTVWQRFTKITLPLLKPAILVALIFRTLDALRIFDLPFVLTKGAFGTNTLSLLAYQDFRENRLLGLGSAVAILTFITVMFVSFIYIRFVGGNIKTLTD